MTRSRQVCQLIGIVVVGVAISSRAVSGERLPITFYTTANGLPHSRIKCIVRDSRGFLWFCTPGGLSRFDGERFVNYGVAQGLAYPSINHLVETRDGTYWVATNAGGVCRFKPGVRRNITDASSSDPSHQLVACLAVGEGFANRVNVLLEDRRGRLWIGTDVGLFHLDPTSREVRFVPDRSGVIRDNVWAMVEDRSGDVWVGGNHGLARYGPDGFARLYHVDEGRASTIWGLMADRAGRLWIGHDRGLVVLLPLPRDANDVARLWNRLLTPTASTREGLDTLSLPSQPGAALAFASADGLVVERPGTLIETADGHVWIASAVWAPGPPRINEFDGRTLRAYAPEHGLSADPIIAIGEDRDRNVWLGTHGGAIRLAKSGLIAYGESDGLAPGLVHAIVAGRGREFYVVTSGLFIHEFNGTRFFGVRPNIGSARWLGFNQTPLVDRQGEWWIPTANGLYRFPRVSQLEDLARIRPAAVYGSQHGVPDDSVLSPFEDARGDIWFGVSDRDIVMRWERASGRFHVYGENDGLQRAGPPVTFREDRAGNLWIGFLRSAVARFRQSRFEVFRSAAGVPSGTIGALHIDGAGRLWIGSRDAALAYMSSTELTPAKPSIGAPDAELARVDEPSAAHPHFIRYPAELLSGFGVRAIAELPAGQLHLGGDQGVQRFDSTMGRIRGYTVADGLPSEDVETAFVDGENRLWFGTWRGLARLVPSPSNEALPPSVLIGQLHVRGVSYPVAELGETDVSGLELGADQNQVEIDFFALAFAAGRPPRYQYMLEGIDTNWGPASDDRRVTYVSLSPGQYRFLVRAVTVDGLVSDPAAISFVILRPLWQRPWFLGVVALALLTLFASLHRARVARLLAVERIRTRIATDLHDDIGSSLSQIAVLSEVIRQRHPDDATLAEPLGRIASTSRELVDGMSDIVWAINPQRDSLQDLVQRMRHFASDVLTARGIDFTFHAPAPEEHVRLGAEIRRHVFLIFKESMNNLARHSRATHAAIELSLAAGTLVLRLDDDGCGFESTHGTLGHGLASMRARANAIGATLEIVSNKEHGTRVRLQVPVHRAWRMRRTAMPRA